MAYRKGKSSRYKKGSSARRRSYGGARGRARKSSGRSRRSAPQTIRIVLEQPTVPTSIGMRELLTKKAAPEPKKARF
jgi:hypothetical protein